MVGTSPASAPVLATPKLNRPCCYTLPWSAFGLIHGSDDLPMRTLTSYDKE